MSIKTSGNLVEVLTPLENLGSPKTRQAMSYAINHTLGKAQTQVVRVLVKQTGLKSRDVRSELEIFKSNSSNLTGEIKAEGGYHKLGEFKAAQAKKGVRASPWGKRHLFETTFMVGTGVFKRVGEERFPIKALYGPSVPKEMEKDKPIQAFEDAIKKDLQPRVEYELLRLLKSR